MKKIYGVLGYPVKHSLSPVMHNAAFRALGIKAEYKLFEVRPQRLNGFLHSLKSSGVYGLNVTVPYKEQVFGFALLDEKQSFLKQVKALNTLVRQDGLWKGFNTDIPGFTRDLKEFINPQGKKVAILGAGGACRAIAYALAFAGAKEIVIFDIDSAKSLGIMAMLGNLFPGFPVETVGSIKELNIPAKDLLINATPIGLKKSDPSLVREELLHKNLFVYDLVYHPSSTKLLALAEAAGAKTRNGLGMLLRQGAFSFKLFTGKAAPLEVMKQALMKAVSKTRSK